MYLKYLTAFISLFALSLSVSLDENADVQCGGDFTLNMDDCLTAIQNSIQTAGFLATQGDKHLAVGSCQVSVGNAEGKEIEDSWLSNTAQDVLNGSRDCCDSGKRLCRSTTTAVIQNIRQNASFNVTW